MPQPIPHPEIIPLSQAINKYFDLSVYFLVLMGFGTLASTGMLDWPTIVLVGSALGVRGYLLAERRRIVFSERWTTPLTIAYFIFYAGDYFLLSHSFLTATVHLVLFAVVVRTFSLRRDRDYTTLAILCVLGLFCGIHANGGGHLRSDGNAKVGASGDVSSAALAR